MIGINNHNGMVSFQRREFHKQLNLADYSAILKMRLNMREETQSMDPVSTLLDHPVAEKVTYVKRSIEEQVRQALGVDEQPFDDALGTLVRLGLVKAKGRHVFLTGYKTLCETMTVSEFQAVLGGRLDGSSESVLS